MELAGHRCIGFCEWDKFATASYTSMHLMTDKQREYLSTLSLKKRRKVILENEYRNGEWYADDIRGVDAGSMPTADCWCFGAPCQDFSVAGKRAGLDGDRSSLVREVFRILREIEEKNRPEWIIYENVKGMLSSNKGFDFLEILLAMDELGYDFEWQIFNSKDWGVPQNRERVYTIGHLRRYGGRKILPIKGADGENRIQQLGNFMPTATRANPNQGRIYMADGLSPCLNKMDGGGREPHIVVLENILLGGKNYNQRSTVHQLNEISRTLISNGHSGNEPKIAIPVLTPDRGNERRFKEDGNLMFTLMEQDRHGVGTGVNSDLVTIAWLFHRPRLQLRRYRLACTTDCQNLQIEPFQSNHRTIPGDGNILLESACVLLCSTGTSRTKLRILSALRRLLQICLDYTLCPRYLLHHCQLFRDGSYCLSQIN